MFLLPICLGLFFGVTGQFFSNPIGGLGWNANYQNNMYSSSSSSLGNVNLILRWDGQNLYYSQNGQPEQAANVDFNNPTQLYVPRMAWIWSQNTATTGPYQFNWPVVYCINADGQAAHPQPPLPQSPQYVDNGGANLTGTGCTTCVAGNQPYLGGTKRGQNEIIRGINSYCSVGACVDLAKAGSGQFVRMGSKTLSFAVGNVYGSQSRGQAPSFIYLLVHCDPSQGPCA